MGVHWLSVRGAPFFIRFFTGMVLYSLQFEKGIPSKVVLIFGAPVILDGASQLLFRESTKEIRE